MLALGGAPGPAAPPSLRLCCQAGTFEGNDTLALIMPLLHGRLVVVVVGI